MTVLQWDQVGERTYEGGVSRGVLYKPGQPGVVWNGITALDEDSTNSVEDVFFDGVKFNNLVTVGVFKGNLKAITYPDEFLECEGTVEDEPGFYLTGQMPVSFGLVYRTEVGNDIEGFNLGYKIHLLYNLTAIPSQKSHQTLSLDASADEFEWSINSIPEQIDYYRPTAHVIFDSRMLDPFLLAAIEEILYGTETTDPRLPSLKSLANFVQNWGEFVVIDNGNGTWTAYTPFEDIITMITPDEFAIDYETTVIVDPDTYILSSAESEV